MKRPADLDIRAARATTVTRPPLHPLVVLAVALLLPGVGQVFNNMTTRALIMLFFMLTLGVVSYHLTMPEQSFIGRHAGGVFVYAISVLDAYRWARYRFELFRQQEAAAEKGKAADLADGSELGQSR